ncbi:helix-turn-helix transcriptional regulator [Frankia sp. AgB1.9]|uniref:ArsR/SmtB family transcription factor n=1 Tax=unclassified Frankia TaxID=2632575 RepID=UPI0019326BF6|nr:MULTISPECIES: metalloregulator ArsR/SmtB family transcription factor [unclassified Frankia]MBL7489920.1 helix-turn-helix transcriptional regulator [Frankia sp. AgW1.1]MBL7552651.1 helix-turn-helix transcriptional regulator [Frankia sp. AgB1.9]MBL7623813.1 helix-turn-helix transcriptional regulator [Frankia sp. AgB1.8]
MARTTTPPAAMAAPTLDATSAPSPGLAGTLSSCCTPLAHAPLSAVDAEQLAGVLKAIAVPARLRLLSMIYARDGGEACVCELTEPLGLTQPTVSHHLKVLVDAGLISRDKRGVWAYYRPVPAAMAALAAMLTPTMGAIEVA